MGTFVPNVTVSVNEMPLSNVTPSLAGYVGGENLILDTFNAIGLIVSEHSDKIDTALTAAEALLTEMEMPTNWTAGIDDVVIAAIPPIDTGTFPEMPAIGSLPGYDDITWTVPDTALSSYTSEMWVTLLNTILDGITNGGTGIPSAVEDAIHERNLEKQRVANEAAYAQGITEISSRALSFPQYAKQALEMQISTEILKQSHDSANAIEIMAAELEQKNMQSMLDRAVAIETLLRAFWKDYNQMRLDGVKVTTDTLIAHIDAITKEREGILKLHETEALVFKAQTEAQKNWYEAISEYQKAQLEKSSLELQKIQSELKAKLDSFIAINSLREKLIEMMGAVSAQVMASGLNAGNVSVGASVSSTKSLSESYQHEEQQSISASERLGEDHNISHKGADIA